jgi:hypothetical protein
VELNAFEQAAASLGALLAGDAQRGTALTR